MEDAKQVLVVEKDPTVRRKISELLQDMGCDVCCACTHGPVNTRVFDLVICDWKDWNSVAPRLHFPGAPPAVLTTAVPDEEEWIAAMRSGAFDFAEEPHSEDAEHEFRRVVASALAARREGPLTHADRH